MDAVAGPNDISVAAANNSLAAEDLGILRNSSGNELVGFAITDVSADLDIGLRDGTRVFVDLSGLATIQDVLNTINSAAPGLLSAKINTSSGTGIDVTDHTGGTTHNFSIANANGSTAATKLEIEKSVGTAVIAGDPVRLHHPGWSK